MKLIGNYFLIALVLLQVSLPRGFMLGNWVKDEAIVVLCPEYFPGLAKHSIGAEHHQHGQASDIDVDSSEASQNAEFCPFAAASHCYGISHLPFVRLDFHEVSCYSSPQDVFDNKSKFLSSAPRGPPVFLIT